MKPYNDSLEYITVTAPYLNPDGTVHIDRTLDVTVRDGNRDWRPLMLVAVIILAAIASQQVVKRNL